ncbi:MAG: DNA-binding protein, partial [Actinobacteria bacterium]|nr:DNA-binding protein [Actinomycetota bacterium]
MSTPQPFRVLPRVTEENQHFWTGGEREELCFLQCAPCGEWIHPPAPICPACLSTEVAPQVSSGRGVIHAFTINRQLWYPDLDPPYVVAIIELADQPGLRLTTNLVGTDPEDVAIGQAVKVLFEKYGDGEDAVWLPFFEQDLTANLTDSAAVAFV